MTEATEDLIERVRSEIESVECARSYCKGLASVCICREQARAAIAAMRGWIEAEIEARDRRAAMP
jgi:hypothetical protein